MYILAEAATLTIPWHIVTPTLAAIVAMVVSAKTILLAIDLASIRPPSTRRRRRRQRW